MLFQFFSWIAVSSATQLFVPKLRVSPEQAVLNARVVGLGAVQPLGGQRQQFLRGSPYVQDPNATELPAYAPVAAVSAVSVVAALAVAAAAIGGQSSSPDRGNVLVFGQGSNELRLLTAKLAARAGYDAAIFEQDEKGAGRSLKLMYGKEYAKESSDVDERARVLVGTGELGEGLSSAISLCLVCDSAPMEENTLTVLLKNTPLLKRVVLISRMGVTRAKGGGFLGIGGEDMKLLENEKRLRAELTARNVPDFSIVRVGVLKGGGPGGPESDFNSGDAELGLSREYLFSGPNVELQVYKTNQAYDQFTLGAKCMLGDPIDYPNALSRSPMGDSFEARDNETSRIVAAAAVVHALGHPSSVELSVAAAKAKSLPNTEEWDAMFNAPLQG
jgi:hypothetical protein